MEVGHKVQFDRYENIRKLQGRIETLKDAFATGQTTRIIFTFRPFYNYPSFWYTFFFY